MKIGIALSGGGMRGIAHAGVIKALEDNGISIDIIGGTSAGSMVASMYAVGYKPDEILKYFKENSSKIIGEQKFGIIKSLTNLIGKKNMHKGFRDGKSIEEIFTKLAEERNVDNIANIKMPIVIPTVDVREAKEYIITNNIPKNCIDETKYITNMTVGEAVRASSSFPVAFNLCSVCGHTFIDGGALDNIPVEEVKKQGADKVIAVKFSSDDIDNSSSMMDLVMKTIDIMGSKIAEPNIAQSDICINIKTEKMGLLDTEKVEECYNYGYETANENMEKILEKLYWQT